VSRRARALAFLLLALLAAFLAAVIADGYGSRVAQGYGPLRTVVVATRHLPEDRVIGLGEASDALVERRVPARFVPPGALAASAEALGLVPRAGVPPGSYLLAAQLRPPRAERPSRALGGDRGPVEIAVGGAGALLATGAASQGTKVDVVVTTEPTGAGRGRTYVAAAAVPLLGLGQGVDGPGGVSAATLGLTRAQALRLIAAESFARRLTLLPRG
jgi:Flp pilus assembly protein CpaB